MTMLPRSSGPIYLITAVIIGAILLNWWITQDVSRESAVPTAPALPPPEQVTVTAALDALTVATESGHRIRYLGVRPPGPTTCFGREALAANQLVVGHTLRLETDPLIDQAQDDAYIRYAYLLPNPSASPVNNNNEQEESEELFINERMLEGGFAFPHIDQRMQVSQRLLAAANYARSTGKGLWSRCEISAGPDNLPYTNTLTPSPRP